MNSRLLGPRLILLLLPVTGLPAQTPTTLPSLRSTNDRDLDLIEALLRTGRFDDALKICQLGSETADPRSDDAAKWAIAKSKVLTSRILSDQQFEAVEIQHAQRPVIEILKAYPEHPRSLFLQTQLASVQGAAAKFFVVKASISSDERDKEIATKNLVTATTAFTDLSNQVADERSRIGRLRDPIVGLDSDLNRLQQELSIHVAGLILMQTELFPRSSDDCIAAATKAEQAIIAAIEKIPVDTPARIEMQRLKVESIFRAGQIDRAIGELDSIFKSQIESSGNELSPSLLALQIQLTVAKGDQQQSALLLSQFYSDAPDQAPRSIEMDLARLEHLLAFDREKVGSWFQAIEQRGGPYARRRAESIALARTGDDGKSLSSDPTILAVEGRDWLRKGDAIRAADLLVAAAEVDTDSIRGLRYAAEAAAALVSVGRNDRAAQVLIDSSRAHSDAAGAAAANLQAIYLLQRSDPKRVEELLRIHLESWPDAPETLTAGQWLHKLLSEQGRSLEAAIMISKCPIDALTEDRVAKIASAWRSAFHQSTDPTLALPTQQFRESMRRLLASPLIQSQYRPLASMLMNREALAGLPAGTADDPFIDALIDFRRQGVTAPALQRPPDDYASDARWRLIRDGRELPQLQASIAKLLQQWDSESEPTLEKAELLLWSNHVAGSIEMVQKLVAGSKRDLDTAKRAASLLGSSDARAAQQEAIRQWDQIAGGTAKGTPLWHEAKIAAIQCLRRIGDHGSANKRAKYILLTMPNMDPMWKSKYQADLP